MTVQVFHSSLPRAKLPSPRLGLREATPNDRQEVLRIAATSFGHGRYHADVRFPVELANRRYASWVDKGFLGRDDRHKVYVIDHSRRIAGFAYTVLCDSVADLKLCAVAPELKQSIVGFHLYSEVLTMLKQAGIRQVVSRPQAANAAVMNIYASLGFRLREPMTVFHWHAPTARHLVALDKIWNEDSPADATQ
jgi:L-amino acid N-acyltransferase YncA